MPESENNDIERALESFEHYRPKLVDQLSTEGQQRLDLLVGELRERLEETRFRTIMRVFEI